MINLGLVKVGCCLPGVTAVSEWKEVRPNHCHLFPRLLGIRDVWDKPERLEHLRFSVDNWVGLERRDWTLNERALRDMDTI
jgi:hypothetical protein